MKVIKHILSLFILCGFSSCNNDDVDRTFTTADGQFVRFFMLVDNDNNVLEYPQVSGGLTPVSSYDKDKLGTLKIPVALTATSLDAPVNVTFSTDTSANLQGVNITPTNTLEFTQTQLTDTIYIDISSNWNGLNNASIKLKLTDVNNPSVSIGMPNSELPNDELTINLIDVEFAYRLENSFEELVGGLNEEKIISIDFPNGFFIEDLESIELLSEIPNSANALDIDYSLEQLPLDASATKIEYKYTLNSNLNDELQYETKLQLAPIPGYTLDGTSEITIRKPVFTPRDNNAFTASNFYDLSDPLYRTYGETWMDFNEDDVCEWRSFNAFTFPVVVDESHPNAVLFDDMGTPNTDDDIYHHAFRIGFNSTISGNTTNAFNLKRWFTNESTSAANSPGFNIEEALEFFPTNGNSITDGFVQVIEQDITIAGTNGNSYVISISGQGTYAEMAPGLFEIIIDFEATNDALFGGTRVSRYRIYNNNMYEDPMDLTEDCFVPIPL